MNDSHATTSYKTYWVFWFVLLVITVAMVFIGNKPVLVSGMLLKATIISLLYMHLKFEKLGLILAVLLGIFATTAVLCVLLIPDALAM
jgi:cytochrome c oxidase subunit IV